MVYKNNIPQPGDSPAVDSQADLLENFAQLNTQYGTAGDHVEWTALADNGMHKQVSLNDVIADPNLPDPQASLYTKTVAGNSELFFENFDVGGAVNLVRQMTNLTVANGVRHGGTQYTWMSPWGIRFTCGVTVAFNGISTDNFITAFNTVVYTALVSPNAAAAHRASIEANTTTLWMYTTGTTTTSMYYLVIGD